MENIFLCVPDMLLKTRDFTVTSIQNTWPLLAFGLILGFLFKVTVLVTRHVQHCEERMNELNKLMTESCAECKKIITMVQEIQSALNNQSLSRTVAPCGARPPPPPPPLPPTLNMITPVTSQMSNKKEEKKKKNLVDGPPQLKLTTEDISNMLKNLKKTANKQKLLCDSTQIKKTPPRRILFKTKTPKRSRNSTSSGDATEKENNSVIYARSQRRKDSDILEKK